MNTHNILFSIYKKISQISFVIFPKGLKNEFETAVVNELVFEPLKVYCIVQSLNYMFGLHIIKACHYTVKSSWLEP